MHQRSCVTGTRTPGGRVRVLVVLLALAALVGLPSPARAAGPARSAAGGPDVASTDQLVVWDGATQTVAVRWHLRAPVTTLHWFVATPAPARRVPVEHESFRAAAAEARPRDRWVVTHPWLLFGSDGEQARLHLEEAGQPGAEAAEVTGRRLSGVGATVAAVKASGAAVDATTRAWAADAVGRGWSVQVVTVTMGSPTTLVGPVALRFATSTPVVPSSPLPRGGRTTLLTVAPRVLAAEQPDPAAPTDDASDDVAGDAADGAADGSVDGAGGGAASESLTTTASGDPAPTTAPARGPAFTVENARTLQVPPAGLAAVGVPSTGWVVTALDGRTPAVAPTLLLPQGGEVADWRTQNGVWWPGWGPLAVCVLAAIAVAGLALVGRRRALRAAARTPSPVPVAQPAVAAAVTASGAGPGTGPDTLTDLRAVEDADALVDTRPDIRPVP